MAAIINSRLILRNSFFRPRLSAGALAVLEAVVVLILAQRTGLWPLAAAVVVAWELWSLRPGGAVVAAGRGRVVLERLPALLVGLSVVLIVALVPRLVTQVVIAGLYVAWRVWWSAQRAEAAAGLMNLLVVQAVMFEALFLMAAIWRTSNWLVITLVWLGAYVSVYGALARRGERAAGLLAATWALICAEVSWVLLLWLFTYTMSGGYILVPQPALILTAMGYCFGSIYASQRQGNLSRGRLTEYLLIALILIAIVITGTPWRGTI